MTDLALLRRAVQCLATSLLLVLPSGRAAAQQSAFRSYGAGQGLLNLGISCLAQDRTGFLLVCTDNGIFRFDGQSFFRYGVADGLPDRGIGRNLLVAPDGDIFAMVSGVLYGARGGRSLHFVPIAGPVPADSEGGARAALLGDDLLLAAGGTLWIASRTATGGFSARPFLPDALLRRLPELRSITGLVAHGNTLWLGCGTGQICRIGCAGLLASGSVADCTDVGLVGTREGLEPREWVALLVDRDGTLWARSPNHILSLRLGETRPRVEPVPGGVGRYVGRTDRLALIQMPDGDILTQGPSGLLVRKAGRWFEIDRAHGLPDGDIATLLVDRHGNLWLGLRGQGLVRAVGSGQWQNWTTADRLLDNVCWQLAMAGDGSLFVATERGVDAVSPEGEDAATLPLLDGSTYAIASNRTGEVWAANLAGVLRRYAPRTKRIDATFRVPFTSMMALDQEGGLLLATHDGMWRVPDPDAETPSAPVRVLGTRGQIRSFAQDRAGRVWLVTGGALIRIDPTARQEPMVEIENIDRTPIAMLFVTPDDLWFGSDKGGLEHLILRDGKPVRIAPIDYPALSSSQVVSMTRDGRGWVWVGSDRGLGIWNGREWRRLGEEDGLLSDDLNEGSMLAAADGSMWFGTAHGLSHLLDASHVFDSVKLHPVISQVLLNGAPLTSRSIPWSRARLTVRFGDLDFRFSDKVVFRYRLEGVDRDWVETRDSTVRYPNLPPGRLTFSLQAIEPGHHLTSDPVSFSLEVRSPWWATFWFRALAALTVIAAATAVWRLRVGLLVAQRRNLEALVALRTKEIAEAHAALEIQASRDGLTGLMNRSAITRTLEELIAAASRGGALSVALADLDHFKSINDRHGHFAGDEVLRQISRRLLDALHPGEFAGRYGGEEFVVLLSCPSQAAERLESICAAMRDGPITVDDHMLAVTCSFGLTAFKPGDDGESLLRRADQLLYRAKSAGRDCIMGG